MREIKFRAKAKFSGTIGSDKWLYSSLMRLDAPTHRLNLAGQDCDIETLGQFTGIRDKNGKEIYEGDKFCVSGIIMFVSWHEDLARFILTTGCGYDTRNCINLDCDVVYEKEVIGNIHETI